MITNRLVIYHQRIKHKAPTHLLFISLCLSAVFIISLILNHTLPGNAILDRKPYENKVGKGENADNQPFHFLKHFHFFVCKYFQFRHV